MVVVVDVDVVDVLVVVVDVGTSVVVVLVGCFQHSQLSTLGTAYCPGGQRLGKGGRQAAPPKIVPPTSTDPIISFFEFILGV